mgnify:CR=1 FL=1
MTISRDKKRLRYWKMKRQQVRKSREYHKVYNMKYFLGGFEKYRYEYKRMKKIHLDIFCHISIKMLLK